MEGVAETGNAFAIPDLWRTSSLADFENTDATSPILGKLEPLSLEVESYSAFELAKELALHLPDLSSFHYGPLEEIDSLEGSLGTSSAESTDIPELLEEDLWISSSQPTDFNPSATLRSWEKFHDKNFQEHRTSFLSEAGPCAYDIALVERAETTSSGILNHIAGRVVQSGPLLAALLQLGLGRTSILYHYEEAEQNFRPHIEDAHMSGYSSETFGSLVASFVTYGNQTKMLENFVRQAYKWGQPCPSLVACAGEIRLILSLLQAHVGNESGSICTPLQLQLVFERPGQILLCLSDLIASIGDPETDEELLSRLYEVVHNSEHKATWVQRMLFQILVSASRPWLEMVGGWLGLQSGLPLNAPAGTPAFVDIREDVKISQSGREVTELKYNFDPSSVPDFMSEGDANLVFETGTSLKLLQTHQPEHPLARSGSLPSQSPKLEWQFSWGDIERTSNLAKEYEFNIRAAIKDFNIYGKDEKLAPNDTSSPSETGEVEQTAKGFIDSSIAAFERPLTELDVVREGQYSMILVPQCLETDESSESQMFAPPISLLASLSFQPLLSAQAQTVDQACLRLLFRENDINLHFSILYRYTLLGDGVFVSRLSHALFDPELPSAERRNGRSRSGTSGLKLGHRDTWPPASSELRLALMGILTDSLFPNEDAEASSLFRRELPGDLSFAIREMSDDELQRCMNPNSIEALDFLRMQYQPPPPLDAIISPSSLTKYDAIFKLLLRIIRMQFVVNQVSRDESKRNAHGNGFEILTSRFGIESRHFVSTLCNYFFDGITSHWHILERRIREIDKKLDRWSLDSGDSVPKLRAFHEQLLDRMMMTLLLRKRQAQVMNLVEETFSVILEFVGQVRAKGGNAGRDGESLVELRELYDSFQQKVKVFVDVCRGLSERRGQGGTKGHTDGVSAFQPESPTEGGENTIGQLLLRFEMSGFYSK